jgi:hypothetical protein
MTVPLLYLYFISGIVLSLLVPIAWKWLKEAQGGIGKGPIMDRVIAFATPIVKVAVASAIIGALLLLVFLGAGARVEETTWFQAILYGYAWDSTLQKIRQAS